MKVNWCYVNDSTLVFSYRLVTEYFNQGLNKRETGVAWAVIVYG